MGIFSIATSLASTLAMPRVLSYGDADVRKTGAAAQDSKRRCIFGAHVHPHDITAKVKALRRPRGRACMAAPTGYVLNTAKKARKFC